jgi:hypothetical protein
MSVGTDICDAPAQIQGPPCETRKRHHVDDVIDAIEAVPLGRFPERRGGH